MGCNCTTDEEINELYATYSQRLKESGVSVKTKIKRAFLMVSSVFMWIIAFPLMIIFVLGYMFWDDKPRINVQAINLMRVHKFFKNV